MDEKPEDEIAGRIDEIADEVWFRIRARVARLIEEGTPLWRDDGADIGRGTIIDLTGTVTKDGPVLSLTGATATLPNEVYISFGGDPLNAQVYIP